MTKNIEMNTLNSNGQYEVIYPKTYAQLTIVDDKISNSYDLNSDSNVDDVLKDISERFIMIQNNVGRVILTVQDSDGNLMKDVLITNLKDLEGNEIYTDSSGTAVGFAPAGKLSLKINNYIDIEDYNENIVIGSGETIIKKWIVTRRNFLKIISTDSYRISGNVNSIDVTSVGGGASGTAGPTGSLSFGTGGGGGYCVVQENVSFNTKTLYRATIGAGGARVSCNAHGSKIGIAGGQSSFLNVSANGGAPGGDYVGGIGNGNGGDVMGGTYSPSNGSVNGRNGSIYGYSSYTETVLYGGGGGATTGIGGAGYGGAGAEDTGSNSHGTDGTDGFGGGGGGCYGYTKDSAIRHSGKGGSGCVAIRIHF